MEGMSGALRRAAIVGMAAVLLALLAPALASAAEPLSPYATFSGEHVALSVDALGTNNPAGGPIQVEKKDAGETVKAAYLFAATTGEENYEPKNGDVTLDGTAVEWEPAHTITSDISSYNAVANVTSIVKPVVDPASPGLIPFTVAEGVTTEEYDGEILAVVLEDPAVSEERSITLLYGAQNPLGDTFHVGLSEPVNKANPSFALNLSLGISYGYQAIFEEGGEDSKVITRSLAKSIPFGEYSQYSTVKVNGQLMSSAAGGQDDCFEKYSPTPKWANECPNGTLITAGGIGDSTADPANPAATPEICEEEGHSPPRCDDELYSLLPFLSSGETGITFETDNPSDNDNIFFGALEAHGAAAVVGEGITLSPATGTNNVGESHTVTASVQNAEGAPIAGATVHFKVTAGPNAGLTGEGTTNSSGKATFTYSSAKAGTDTIAASFTNVAGASFESNAVSQTWVAPTSSTTTTTTTTTTATTAAKPASGVLAFGTAHLASSSKACVAASGYLASVSGKNIKSVTYTLDGHKIKTITHASNGAYSLRIKVSSGKQHHLSIRVVFTSATHTSPVTLHKTLARCAARVITPRFTG